MYPVQPFSLSTPIEIDNEARRFFPLSKLTKLKDEPLHLNLSLGYGIPPLRIKSCLMQLNFMANLSEMALKLLKAESSGVSFSPKPLNVSSFSIKESPLSGWLQYQRIIYSRDNKNCKNVIRDYLHAPAASIPGSESDLRILGFAPDQVEGPLIKEEENLTQAERHLIKDTLSYFKLAIKGLPVHDARIKNLRSVYPKMTWQLAMAIEAEKLAKPVEDRYESILTQLQASVIGQECATIEMASTLAKTNPNENSVFLFVGPTGTGKTELAKAVAKLKNDRMITFEMEQLKNPESVSTLFGSSAGHVGSTDKPQIAKEFEKYDAALTQIDPNNIVVNGVVIIFDEFEKAHPQVKQSFLTLFGEGYCKVRYTEGDRNINIKYTLRNCIIVNTSNWCYEVILKAFHHKFTTEQIVKSFTEANKALQENPKSSSPELIGRMNIIPFGPIPKGPPYQKLIGMKLDSFLPKMQKEIGCKAIDVEDRLQVLKDLETTLYGDGVDIRRVDKCYKSLENEAVRNKRHWGEMEQVKLTLYCDASPTKKLKIRASVYSELADSYIPKSGLSSSQVIEEEEKKE